MALALATLSLDELAALTLDAMAILPLSGGVDLTLDASAAFAPVYRAEAFVAGAVASQAYSRHDKAADAFTAGAAAAQTFGAGAESPVRTIR